MITGSPHSTTDIETSEASLQSSRVGASSSELKETSVDDKEEESKEKEEEKDKSIPIVFHWDHGGNDVYVCGSFNNWERIPMNKRYFVYNYNNKLFCGKF